MGDFIKRKLLLQNVDSQVILNKLDDFTKINQEGWNIYLRVHQFYKTHFFIIDDVVEKNLYQFNTKINSYWMLEPYNTDFDIVDVIQTSPQNYQLWLYNKNPFKLIDKNLISKKLCELFSGDVACIDMAKFARLVGFKNMKPEHESNYENKMEPVKSDALLLNKLKFNNTIKQKIEIPTSINTLPNETTVNDLEDLNDFLFGQDTHKKPKL